MPGTVRIGISGWRYPPWRGVFYPKGLPQRRELEFASRELSSIEINGTFYSLQRESSFRQWRDETPEGFVFSVKGSRFITHMKKLRDVEGPLSTFMGQGVLALREKLGPFLWQFPPNFTFDAMRMEGFFEILPHALEGLALRHAVEIRHESFKVPAFTKLLHKHGIALVVADTAGKWPLIEAETADFMYLRLHGDEPLYVSGYTPQALESWARKVRRWRDRGQDVYCYFDNDAKVHAPFDARSLAARLDRHGAVTIGT